MTKIDIVSGFLGAGKTTLISRILKEFKPEDGWKVITIPETATDLISGFGLGPFPGCMSMEDFQYFVVSDQLHKEQLALKGAETVPEEKVLIIVVLAHNDFNRRCAVIVTREFIFILFAMLSQTTDLLFTFAT